MDRRDFMKLLGVGSSIVPLVGGIPAAAEAVIVKPPEIEIPRPGVRVSPLEFLHESFEGLHVLQAVLYLRNHRGNATRLNLETLTMDTEAGTGYGFNCYPTSIFVSHPVGDVIPLSATFTITSKIVVRDRI